MKYNKTDEFCFFISGSWGENANRERLETLSNALVALGHKVVIILDHQQQDMVKTSQNPACYTWPSYRPTGFKDAVFLKKLIKKYRPNCLISQFGSVNIMTLVGWWMHVPHRMVRYETTSRQIDIDTRLSKLRVRMLRLRKRWVMGFATAILANSKAAAGDVEKLYKTSPDKVKVFYNYLADPLESAPELTEIKPKEDRIVCVGRFNYSKGQDIIIKALSLLPKSLALSVEFIGNGETLQTCKQLAESLGVGKQCHFSGSIPHNQVFEKFANVSCSVVPSRDEAFGYICVESLAVSTPVIGSSVGGIPEIVRDGVDGLLFEPDNPQSLADKLMKFFGPNFDRGNIRANARQRFLTAFETSVVLTQQVDWLFEKVRQK